MLHEEQWDKISESEEYKKIHYEYSKLFEKLMEGLDEGQKKMLDELYILSGGLQSAEGLVRFKEGFKLCMRLVFEGISR